MNIEQPLEGLTWGELRAFVQLAAHERDDDRVVFEYDTNDGSPKSIFTTGVPALTVRWLAAPAPIIMGTLPDLNWGPAAITRNDADC